MTIFIIVGAIAYALTWIYFSRAVYRGQRPDNKDTTGAIMSFILGVFWPLGFVYAAVRGLLFLASKLVTWRN